MEKYNLVEKVAAELNLTKKDATFDTEKLWNIELLKQKQKEKESILKLKNQL